MGQHIFRLSLNIEVTTEKLSKFMIPIKSNYHKNFNLNKQKSIFEHDGRLKKLPVLKITILFAFKLFGLPF